MAAEKDAFDWLGDTWPFTGPAGAVPANFTLRQVSDDDFVVKRPFFYHRADGETLEVSANTLPETDFASIPFFLSWFASRHGRHTPAVLLHDVQITSTTPPAERVEADRLLLETLGECSVPPIRRHLMWAGVSLATRRKMGLRGIGGIALWLVAAAAGTSALVIGIRTLDPLLVAAGAIGPFAGAVFWGRQYWAGVVAGYGLWLVALPAAASLAGYYTYWTIEHGFRSGRRIYRRLRPEPEKAPAPLPKPPSYKAA